jgi:hypothetical protein
MTIRKGVEDQAHRCDTDAGVGGGGGRGGAGCRVRSKPKAARLDFVLKDADGKPVKLTDFKGKVILTIPRRRGACPVARDSGARRCRRNAGSDCRLISTTIRWKMKPFVGADR